MGSQREPIRSVIQTQPATLRQSNRTSNDMRQLRATTQASLVMNRSSVRSNVFDATIVAGFDERMGMFKLDGGRVGWAYCGTAPRPILRPCAALRRRAWLRARERVAVSALRRPVRVGDGAPRPRRGGGVPGRWEARLRGRAALRRLADRSVGDAHGRRRPPDRRERARARRDAGQRRTWRGGVVRRPAVGEPVDARQDAPPRRRRPPRIEAPQGRHRLLVLPALVVLAAALALVAADVCQR